MSTIKLLVIQHQTEDDALNHGGQGFSWDVNAILEAEVIGGHPAWRLWADETVFPGFSGDEVYGGSLGDAVDTAVKHLAGLSALGSMPGRDRPEKIEIAPGVTVEITPELWAEGKREGWAGGELLATAMQRQHPEVSGVEVGHGGQVYRPDPRDE